MKFKLKRYVPQNLEIEILSTQLIAMFPIEIQQHQNFGKIRRVWKVDNEEFSVEKFSKEDIDVISTSKIHSKVKDDILFRLLQNIDKFKIILYYADREDIYEVEKVID